jgi:hypothetical protein
MNEQGKANSATERYSLVSPVAEYRVDSIGHNDSASTNLSGRNAELSIVGFQRGSYGYPIGIEGGQDSKHVRLHKIMHWLKRRRFSITFYYCAYGGMIILLMAVLQGAGVV